MISRKLQLSINNSFFLFGARGVGKSTLLKTRFADIPLTFIDLLRLDVRNQLLDEPDRLEQMIPPNTEWVIIDEVQKIPELLDVVHRLIEERGIKFGLTGSSARKLKHGGANLLAGRAFVYNLFPFTSFELGDLFNLEKALMWGTLPRIFALDSEDDRIQFLKSYANTYIQEEVWEAHLIKDLVPYRRFLQVAAQTNGTVINYSNISNDTRVDPKTVQRYFQILEETLLGFFLEPFHKSLRKRQRANPKFYFFDIGVQRALTSDFAKEFGRGSLGFGNRFEHFVICEIVRLNHYYQSGFDISFIREDDDLEIDVVLSHPSGKLWFIEIKSTDFVQQSHGESLLYFGEKFRNAKGRVWSCDPIAKSFGNIAALPWQDGLKEVFEFG
ncbi:MAG: AAA family ATPase [Proteobacteria bacterium]|nr:AAA family ATPase [Pseudomonadota bacterium]